ncbi:MAG: N,N-dimethylformamidase beta subunit family domain-containing protein [Pirellulaceae bacterium]
MKESQNPKRGIHRRDLIKGTAAAGLAFTVGVGGEPQAAAPADDNPIRKENAKPGTRDWLLTKTDVSNNEPVELWRSPRVEGYCSTTSVSTGDTLKVMVSTNPVSEFSLEIFRTGYYGGTGGRSMKKFESIQGKTQPDPAIGEHRLRECKWEASVEFEIPDDWVSGVYLGKLTAKKGGVQSYVIFFVRDARPCDLLFQCSDTTWQAYNSWPTNEWSLYHTDEVRYTGYKKRKKWLSGGPTGWVSFDRPYGQFCQDHLVDRPDSVGSGEFLLWEFPLTYWMEQQSYDVSYQSGVDTHKDGPGLQRAKGFISVGHDEYWTRDMYDSAIAARDAGVNLAFLSGNAVLGVVPLLPSAEGQPHRIMLRESLFFGEQFGRRPGAKYPPGPDGALLMGGRHAMGGVGGGDWVCAKPDHWVFEGTGMKKGDGVQGLVGWEWHSDPARDLPGHEILAEGETKGGKDKSKPPHAATIYDGPKGNVVFNAATIWWAQGLSSPPGHVLPAHRTQAQPQGPDPRVQRMTANVFDRFIQ